MIQPGNIAKSVLLLTPVLLALSACVSDTTPQATPDTNFPSNIDLANGQQVFWAGGCSSCHAAPGSGKAGRLRLGGGLKLETQFGIFTVPNISPDKATGIGTWSNSDFSNALLKGVAPDGSHYYPSFPYTSYARMTRNDVSDLWAFLKSLPVVANKPGDHKIFGLIKSRKAIGLWNRLYLKRGKVVRFNSPSPEVDRGQYLVEGPGHCGECHTPRNKIGGFNYNKWLGGGVDESGDKTIPNITPGESGIGGWSIEEIIASLKPATGHAPSGSPTTAMAEVRQNLAMLKVSDRQAIAAYLKAIPAVESDD